MSDTPVIRFQAQTLRDLESLAPAWNLEQLLDALRYYGKPRLSFIREGWHCSLEMHPPATGITFEVKSDFDCVTSGDAARQCTARLVAAIRSYSNDTTI